MTPADVVLIAIAYFLWKMAEDIKKIVTTLFVINNKMDQNKTDPQYGFMIPGGMNADGLMEMVKKARAEEESSTKEGTIKSTDHVAGTYI